MLIFLNYCSVGGCFVCHCGNGLFLAMFCFFVAIRYTPLAGCKQLLEDNVCIFFA